MSIKTDKYSDSFALNSAQKQILLNKLPIPQLLKMYEKMSLIRCFEGKVAEISSKGYMHGPAMLSIGMEACPVGCIIAADKEDYIIHHHRGHGHTLAKGGNLVKMFAELMGKETGYCHGRGGSMHIADISIGDFGATGIVGAGISTGVGIALALKMDASKKIIICFFGDGAVNTGEFHEAVNLASVWKLPILFFCENNQYGMSMAVEKSMNVSRIAERSKAYGIPGITVDGNDVLCIFDSVSKAIEQIRSGNGPGFIEALTYRISPHKQNEDARYRNLEEVCQWQKQDPILRLEQDILSSEICKPDDFINIQTCVQAAVEGAFAQALSEPEPDIKNLEEEVYA